MVDRFCDCMMDWLLGLALRWCVGCLVWWWIVDVNIRFVDLVMGCWVDRLLGLMLDWFAGR